MSIFKKKSSTDTIDLTELERKGIIKKAQQISKIKNPDGYAKLSNFRPALPETIPPNSTSPFSFLDSLASASSNTEVQTSPSANNEVEKQINHINTKIEDLEYKLERFLDRLVQIEGKLKQD